MTSSASHKHDISLSCLNMTIHLCTKSRKSHEEIIFPSGEQQYNWPVRSPDLNPIQQRWEVETWTITVSQTWSPTISVSNVSQIP